MTRPLLRRPLVLIVGLALLLALSGSVSAPPAHATGTLTAGGPYCTSGNWRFDCFASASGGTAPYSYTWQAVANAVITSNSGYNISGTCNAGQFTSLKVTVHDSLGATASKTGGTNCRSAPWQ